MNKPLTSHRANLSRGTLASCVVVAVCLGLVACEKKQARSYNYFMEDRIAREGTLVRCDKNPLEAQTDIECANASRAAVEIALQAERERSIELERESERQMAAMRQQLAERDRVEREALRAAVREELEAYEALWRIQNAAGADEVPGDSQNLFDLPESIRGAEQSAE